MLCLKVLADRAENSKYGEYFLGGSNREGPKFEILQTRQKKLLPSFIDEEDALAYLQRAKEA